MKGIRLNEEGDASLEDITNSANQGTDQEPSMEPEGSKSNNKKVLLTHWYILFV